jgi:hypothetical protein
MSSNKEKNNKLYTVTMVVSMLITVALVMGTPLFNDFVPNKNKPVVSQPLQPNSQLGTAGSSF